MTFATPNPISDSVFPANSFETLSALPVTLPATDVSDSHSQNQSRVASSEPSSALKSDYDRFAEDLRSELVASTELEKVLIERVILGAWRLELATRSDLERMVNKNTMAPISRELLRAECSLETTFSLLENARRICRPRWGCNSEPFLRTEAPEDLDNVSEDEELTDADFSNEWPILNADSNPRDAFREVIEESSDDLDDVEIDDAPSPSDTRWQDRLVYDFNISETSPVVKGTWITVSQIVSLIVDGNQWSDILRDYPELTEDDIRICLAYTVEQDNFGEI